MVQKLGVLGGSFDPVHNGHIQFALAALDELALSAVLFIPAATPPHKLSRKLVSARHRLRMLELAAAGHENIRVDNTEIERGGISFTWQTLTTLRATHREAEFYFIIGSDTLHELATWARLDVIARLVTFAVAHRDPHPPGETASPELDSALRGEILKTVVLQAKPARVSSTEIRTRIAAGEPWESLVPPAVAGYIRKEGLYSADR